MKKITTIFFIWFFYFCLFASSLKIPVWQIPYIDQKVVVDGVLNEPAYQKAFKYDNFYQTSPGYNIKPSEKTEVYTFVNSKGIVFGIVCFSKNGQYSMIKTRRDEIIRDDKILVAFDPEGKAKKFYVIGISPVNCVFDGLNDGGSLSLDFDINFKHATKVYKDKFILEIFIPFSSIAFPSKKKQKWLLDIERTIAREVTEEDVLYKDIRDSNDPRVTMVYLNFELPEDAYTKRKQRSLKLIPSFVYSHLKHEEEFFGQSDNYSSDKGDLGLTVEYSPSSNTMLKATIHPDFSQVEADDAYQRVNNRYPVYLREKRPFFMDGMESFSTPFDLLYTRNIVKPEYGVKFSSKFKNKYGLYLISAMEKDVPGERFGLDENLEKDTYWNVIRSTYNLDEKGSFLGFMGILRNYGSFYNSVISGDGKIQKGKLTILFQGMVSNYDKENSKEQGNGMFLSVNYLLNEYVDFGGSYSGVSPDFKDDAGFFQRTDARSYKAYVSFHYSSKTDEEIINYVRFDLLGLNSYDYSSQMFDQISQITLMMSLRHRIYIFSNFHWNSNLFYNNKIFETHSAQLNIIWSEHSKFSPGISYWKGTDVLYSDNPILVNAKSYSVFLSSSFSCFSLSSSFFIYKYTDRITDQTIRKQKALEVVGTYFFNDYMNFKVFYISDLADLRDYDYNEPYHYINLLFTWRKNAFTKLYIGYNNGHSSYRTSDETLWGFDRDKNFYVKMTYLF